MKLKATMVVVYDRTEEQLKEWYGTDDPQVAAKIDQEAFNDDPGVFLSVEGISPDVVVEVVDD
jgi:hypothetical protein